MNKLYITTEADRLTVAAVLVKNRYRIRMGSQRRAGTKSYDYFVEYEPLPGKPPEGKLYIEDEADQLAVACILVKNKYTVKSFSQIRKGSRHYYFLEYERNPEPERKVET